MIDWNWFAEEKAASHFSEMSTAFKSKAQQFADQVICDVQSTKDASDDVVDQSAQPLVPATEGQPSSADPSDPQAYRQENRLSEFGKTNPNQSHINSMVLN